MLRIYCCWPADNLIFDPLSLKGNFLYLTLDLNLSQSLIVFSYLIISYDLILTFFIWELFKFIFNPTNLYITLRYIIY